MCVRITAGCVYVLVGYLHTSGHNLVSQWRQMTEKPQGALLEFKGFLLVFHESLGGGEVKEVIICLTAASFTST